MVRPCNITKYNKGTCVAASACVFLAWLCCRKFRFWLEPRCSICIVMQAGDCATHTACPHTHSHYRHLHSIASIILFSRAPNMAPENCVQCWLRFCTNETPWGLFHFWVPARSPGAPASAPCTRTALPTPLPWQSMSTRYIVIFMYFVISFITCIILNWISSPDFKMCLSVSLSHRCCVFYTILNLRNVLFHLNFRTKCFIAFNMKRHSIFKYVDHN